MTTPAKKPHEYLKRKPASSQKGNRRSAQGTAVRQMGKRLAARLTELGL